MCGVTPVGSQVPDIFAQVCQMYYQPLSEIILKTNVSPEKKPQKQTKQTLCNMVAKWFIGHVEFGQGLGLILLEVFLNLNDSIS